MKKTLKKVSFSDLPNDYPSLCALYLPRPIHDKIGYENALEIAESMAGFEDRFSPDQSDYFELITDLISDYEEQAKGSAEKTPPIKKRLHHLLESSGWSASKLGRFLGLDATMGNKIVRGERQLTADHIRKLSQYFSLRAEYFL